MKAKSGQDLLTGLRSRGPSRRPSKDRRSTDELRGHELGIEDALHKKNDTLLWTPAKKIQLAILRDALLTLNIPEGKVYEDTIRWIIKDEEDYIFSFIFCCRSLGLDPSAVRKIVLCGRRFVEKEMAASF